MIDSLRAITSDLNARRVLCTDTVFEIHTYVIYITRNEICITMKIFDKLYLGSSKVRRSCLKIRTNKRKKAASESRD